MCPVRTKNAKSKTRNSNEWIIIIGSFSMFSSSTLFYIFFWKNVAKIKYNLHHFSRLSHWIVSFRFFSLTLLCWKNIQFFFRFATFELWILLLFKFVWYFSHQHTDNKFEYFFFKLWKYRAHIAHSHTHNKMYRPTSKHKHFSKNNFWKKFAWIFPLLTNLNFLSVSNLNCQLYHQVILIFKKNNSKLSSCESRNEKNPISYPLWHFFLNYFRCSAF